jgi:hypothetical protein
MYPPTATIGWCLDTPEFLKIKLNFVGELIDEACFVEMSQ